MGLLDCLSDSELYNGLAEVILKAQFRCRVYNPQKNSMMLRQVII